MNGMSPQRAESLLERTPRRFWHLASIGFVVVCALLFLAVLVANLQRPYVVVLLSLGFAAAIFALIFLLVGFSRQLRREQRETTSVLHQTAEEFEQMADNIREIFWSVDTKTKGAIYTNQAFETLTGHSLRSFVDDAWSCTELIHPEDRPRVLAQLAQASRNGYFDEKFRILSANGDVRWVWVRGVPVRDATGQIVRVLGTALEITAEKEAEARVAENLYLAQSASCEAEALRKATMGLTQDLRMDSVLDALLQSLADLVPFTCARLLIPEGGPHVLVLGERLCPDFPGSHAECPLVLNTDGSSFLRQIVSEQKSVLISDTKDVEYWITFPGHTELRSWLSVPLVASGQYLGFLSIGHREPDRFTEDHLRRAQLLAIPAAVAIQNSRLYEKAAIYGEELERRVKDLSNTQRALAQSEAGRRASEERFQKVFRSSPIPFSITTLLDGRFLDINSAFEQRYGYSRQEVIDHSVHELRIWEVAQDRAFMLTQLEHGPIRNLMTRLRTKSGEIKLTVYSADKIEFDDQTCILAVSGDVLENNRPSN
jgi:PAS domain S-box-containing protein